MNIKPGTQFTLLYEVVRPVESGEQFKSLQSGEYIMLNNYKGNLFWGKCLDFPESSLQLFCLDNLPDRCCSVPK